jgi:eukaryotic-like serine/threonine-protein kinase
MAPDQFPEKAALPTRIGKYKVIDHIASGGMGAVYRATDTDSGCEVALKVMAGASLTRPSDRERFRREAASAAKLNHENIVKLYDSGEFENLHFLALEFVDGIDLKEYIARKGKLSPVKARRLILQAARALAHVHEQGIIHRDIKPSNFLVMKRGDRKVLKLIDLGLAREVDSEEFRITRANHTLGTIDYMSPEQARDSGTADVRSDIYSLGCTLYHMLAGYPPFPDGGLAERLYKHCEVAPPDIRTVNPEVTPGLARILSKMLSKKPYQRYQTANELIEDLRNSENFRGPINFELLEDLGPQENAPKPLPPQRQTRFIGSQADSRRRRRRDDPVAPEPVPEKSETGEAASPSPKPAIHGIWIWAAAAILSLLALGLALCLGK